MDSHTLSCERDYSGTMRAERASRRAVAESLAESDRRGRVVTLTAMLAAVIVGVFSLVVFL